MTTPAGPAPESMTPEQYVEKLLTSLRFFVEELWNDRGLDQVAPLGDVERDILDWAQNGPAQRGVIAFRSVGKTHLVTASIACWYLLRDPDTKILIVSKSKIPHARDTVRLIREWIGNVPFLRHLDPGVNTSVVATDQTFQFDVNGSKDSRTPSVIAQGIEGQITGSRAHLVLADDVETPENTETLDAREKLEKKVKEFKSIATYGKKEIIYVGTFHHEESLYLKLSERGYHFRTWPFVYPEPGDELLNLAPLLQGKLDRGEAKPGDLTCPHRFTDDDRARFEAEGFTYYSTQFRCLKNTGKINRYPLRLSDIPVLFDMHRDEAPLRVVWGTRNNDGGDTGIPDSVIPATGINGQDRPRYPILISPRQEWMPYAGTKAFVDPAGVGEDLTGVCVIGALGALLFVKGWRSFRGGASIEQLDEIARFLRRHGAQEVKVETNNDVYGLFFPLFEAALRRAFLEPGQDPLFPDGWKCAAERHHSTGMKEGRIIDAVEPPLSSHRLIFAPECLEPDPNLEPHQQNQYQLTRIRKQRKCLKEDGAMDALSGCIAMWGDRLRLDPEKTAKRKEDDALARAQKFFRGLQQVPRPEPNWIGWRSRSR